MKLFWISVYEGEMALQKHVTKLFVTWKIKTALGAVRKQEEYLLLFTQSLTTPEMNSNDTTLLSLIDFLFLYLL